MSSFVEFQDYTGRRHFVNVDHIVSLKEMADDPSGCYLTLSDERAITLAVRGQYDKLIAEISNAQE